MLFNNAHPLTLIVPCLGDMIQKTNVIKHAFKLQITQQIVKTHVELKQINLMIPIKIVDMHTIKNVKMIVARYQVDVANSAKQI